ncbi:MAG: YncE family protein [Candidatus Omnitrophica bacterium]|nr:YncE family protein [Candidatus Omnitrophota bacterium]
MAFLRRAITNSRKGLLGLFLLVLLVCGKSVTGWCADYPNQVIKTIGGLGLNNPQGVAINPAGSYAYVTNFDYNTVSVIDTEDNTVTDTITVGRRPTGVAITPDGNHVYVANNSDEEVSVIQTSDNTVTDTITVGAGP